MTGDGDDGDEGDDGGDSTNTLSLHAGDNFSAEILSKSRRLR